MASGLYDELKRANRRATRWLLAGAVVLVAVLVWIVAGWLLGPAVLDPVVGVTVTAIGTGVGLLMTYLAYRSGPTLALKANRAREVTRHDAPELHNLLDEVCVSAGIMGTKPKLHVVQDPAPNAFATGLKLEDSHIAVTTGLVEQLPRYELRAVIAHEVAHIVNDDIRAVTIAVATAGVVALLADVMVRMLWWGGAAGGGRRRGGGGNQGVAQLIFLVLGLLAVILAPIAAQMIRFAVSRQREYLADATAADILRDPQSMANALRRIEQVPHTLQKFEAATAHLWFDEPNETRGKDRAAKMARRFATHPTIRERVERLATLNAGMVDIDGSLPPGPSAGRAQPGGPGPSTSSPPPTAPPPGAPPPGLPPFGAPPPGLPPFPPAGPGR